MEVKGYRYYILNSVCNMGVMNKREVIVVCLSADGPDYFMCI